MNPFDIKSALLARHAQHVVLIHFPIALFMVGVTFDAIAERTQSTTLALAAHYNLLVAAIAAVPTFLSGVLAWRWALQGATLKGILLLHFLIGLTLTILMQFVAWLHLRAHRRQQPMPIWRFPIEAFVFVLLGVTAHLGGFLSGVNG